MRLFASKIVTRREARSNEGGPLPGHDGELRRVKHCGARSPVGSVAVLAALALAGAGMGCSTESEAGVTGTVSYRERIALPPDAVVDLRLEDVSRQDAPATVIAEQTLDPAPAVPISFALAYDPKAIDERHRYVVRATIRRGEHLLFVTDTAYPVLTQGHPAHADLVLVRSGGGEAPVADAELLGTRWMLRTLGGDEVPPGPKPAFLQMQEKDGVASVFGNGGCNSFRGPYTLEGSSLAFGRLVTTMMACPPPGMEQETRFLRALDAVASYEIRGTWLVLSGPDGELAALEAWYE